jgi:diaminopimelate epimerase
MLITKYNASGNDFLIFHTFLKQDFSDIAKKLCNRHSGIGADGLIVLIPHSELDF